MEERQVAITGLGAVSPVGNTVEDAWRNLLAGCSGIRTIPEFVEAQMRCQFGGPVRDLDMGKYLEPKEQSRLDPFCCYAMAAGMQALAQSGIDPDSTDFNPRRAGVLVSSGIGGLETSTQQAARLFERGARAVSPLTIPMMIADMASGYLAIHTHFQGPNFGIVSACASGLHSIGEAAWIIRRGDADLMLAGGAENGITPLGHAAFASMRAFSTRNDDPQHASRPFDLTRDGFVPASGAGVLMLEELEHARKRGARILALLSGYGATGDAHHITAPREDGEAAAEAVRIALSHAGLSPESIGYVNAHGTSTHLNDLVETRALKRALGDHARRTPVSSTKSMTGHMLGAAGGFESVVCVQALLHGIVPGTMNLNTPDPECDLDYIPNQARELPGLQHVLKLNMGFGGHNAAVVFSRYQG